MYQCGIDCGVAAVGPADNEEICWSLLAVNLHFSVRTSKPPAVAMRLRGEHISPLCRFQPEAGQATQWSPKRSRGCPQLSQGVPAAASGRIGPQKKVN